MSALPSRVLLLVVALLGAASLYVAAVHTLADVSTMRARAQIMAWQRDASAKPTIPEIGRARNDLADGLRWLPSDPSLLEQMGYLYGLRAARLDGLPELQAAMIDEVIAYNQAALRSRPMSPYAWSNVALGLHLRNLQPTEMWEAFDRAMAYGQREGGVNTRLATIALARWNELGEDRQLEVVSMIVAARGQAARKLRKQVAESGIESLRSVLTE